VWPPGRSRLEPFKAEIRELLRQDLRLTGVRVRELIEPLGFDGSETIWMTTCGRCGRYLRSAAPISERSTRP
jgi:hypothetical protein